MFALLDNSSIFGSSIVRMKEPRLILCKWFLH